MQPKLISPPMPARWCAAAILALLCVALSSAHGAETIPPAPSHYFNDNAGVVSASDAQRFDQQLQQFEQQTSNQVLVAIYPKMQSDSDIADYTFRVKEAWKVGQKVKNNGVVLFVFVQDHTMFIDVGYGLEGALPDATCKQIIDEQIAPHFKTGDYAGGLSAGINSILAATKGEYQADQQSAKGGSVNWVLIIIVLFIVFSFIRSILRNHLGGTVYEPNRRPTSFWENASWFAMNAMLNSRSSNDSFFGGGGGSGGGGGGGGFSGGGGTGGGGGAGGSW